MTRIIGGDLRGRSIKVPDTQTRPTSNRVREAIFSSVEHAVSGLSDLRVLDLFAGSGAFGIESISRGAAEAVLIEKDLQAADTLHSNDLEQRREGDVLGRNQSGVRSSLKLVSILRDEEILEQARIAAVAIVSRDPELVGQPALARAVQSLIDQARAEFVKKS